MADIGRNSRLLCAVGVGLFGAALAAGIIQSMRVDGRLPAIDLLRNGSGAYLNRLLARNDYDAAIAELEMQARMGLVDADARELLGKLLGKQGRPEEARAQFQELVRLRPEYAEAYCFLGNTYIDTNQPDLAADNFLQAIDLNSQLPSAFNGLGVARGQLGDLAAAEKCFAKAVELAPNYVDAQVNLDRARKAMRVAPDGVKKDQPRN